MNKGILKRICIVFLTFILFFNSCNIIYAAGAITEEDTIDDSVSNTDSDDEDHSQDIPITNTENTYTISGKVWEDKKNITNEYGVLKGDGIYQEKENLISGMTVNLYNKNSNEPKSTTTNQDGYYFFDNVEYGEYKVDFVYPTNNYNGLDYKSTNNTTVIPTSNIITSSSPIDIVFLIDLSNSMKGDKLEAIKTSLKNNITQLLSSNNNIRIALISFSFNAKIESNYTNNLDELLNKVNNLQIIANTNTASALKFTHKYINNNSRNDAKKYLFVFTDGLPDITYYNRNNQKLVTTSAKTGNRNIYALMLYGWYYDTNTNTKIDNFHYKSTTNNLNFDVYFNEPILEEGSYDISNVPTSYDEAKKDFYKKTQEQWNKIQEDSSISSYAIATCKYESTKKIFKEIFGDNEHTFTINDDSNSIIKIFESILADNFMTFNNYTNENVSYAIDSKEKRLEYMKFLMNINYDTITNIGSFLSQNTMIASTPYFYVGSNADCSNINLALEERPRASVEISKKVSHLTITLSDGNTLIDWTPNQNVKNLMVIPGTSLTAIMDDEITHGAIIKIEYKITLENKSENDTLSNYFSEEFLSRMSTDSNYSKWFELLYSSFGNNHNISEIINEIIPTRYCIYDYLDNNSIFDAENSPYWKIVNISNLVPLDDKIDTSNITILSIPDLLEANNNMFPEQNSKPLILNTSKIMTIADTDLLTYNNYVEVVQYNNVLGRRVYNVTPGNLDIYDANHELEKDEAKAETVTRVPPFGKDLSYYTTIVGIIILAIEIAVLSTLKIKIKHLKNRYIRK